MTTAQPRVRPGSRQGGQYTYKQVADQPVPARALRLNSGSGLDLSLDMDAPPASGLSEVDAKARQAVELGETVLADSYPFFGIPLLRLNKVWTRTCPSMGVDYDGRLYINPDFVADMDPREVGFVLAHEANHLLRDHRERRGDRMQTAWNIAGDLEINGEIAGLPMLSMPESGLMPGEYRLSPDEDPVPPGLTAEQYYRLMEQHMQEKDDPRQGGGQQEQSGPAGGQGGEEQTPGGGQSEDQEGQDGEGGQGGGQSEDQEGQDGEGQGGGQSQDGQQDQQPAAGRQGQDGQDDAGQSGHSVGCGHCGSGAGGARAPWEEAAAAEADRAKTPTLSHEDMEEMRDRAAREALEADKHNSHGTVPAGLRRWAEARVKAKVNWRAQLKSTLGRAVQSRQGMVVGKARGKAWHPSNVPFRRGSRPGVLHPTKVRARPQVALVIDTSGSMRSADLDAAMSEAVGIVAEAGSVMLIPTDAATGTIRHVRQGSRNELRKMALEGGGGTDMGAGVEAAAEAGATTVVVLTDGFTPWPAEKPAKLSNVVVGVIDQPEYSPPPTPEWAKTVVIKTDD